MQPLIEEIIEMARSKNEDIRAQYLMLIEFIVDLQHYSFSYDERAKCYSHISDKYLAIYLFGNEWGEIAHFLSRLFIDDYSEATDRVIYCLKLVGADTLEPLLDILIEVPERLDSERMRNYLEQTLYELLNCRYRSPERLSERASGKELKKLLTDTSLLSFLTKLSKSDLAGKPVLVPSSETQKSIFEAS